MACDELLQPTIHVEVLVTGDDLQWQIFQEIQEAVAQRLLENNVAVQVGQAVGGLDGLPHEELLSGVEIVDYTGPENCTGFYRLDGVRLEVQTYVLHHPEIQRSVRQTGEDETRQARAYNLPNAALHDEWNSLVFDDGLPRRLLRYLVRMMTLLRQPGLNLSAFNWNRLCLLHGPPGSGKSTLCRALAQKMSIRLRATFNESVLVEINANALLSKYFGESGKQITSTFDGVADMAQTSARLVCVVIDEIETIAGSRERLASNNECHDGLRATNQLLTALDGLRQLPNVLVLCTSNLVEAIDPAFLDRVDIKQLVPSPSPSAIYNIFRSCLNELARTGLIDIATQQLECPRSAETSTPTTPAVNACSAKASNRSTSSSSASMTTVPVPFIPSLSEMKIREISQPNSAGSRVWALAQECKGFSGRTLRRLPILGMAMHTWGSNCSLHDAVSALEAAVEQELQASKIA